MSVAADYRSGERDGLGNGREGLTVLRGEPLRRALAVGIVLGAAALVFSWPEQLPGLVVDEAWSFFRARAIIDGLRPLDGMNYYTGALHQYLLAAGVELFGLRVWVARLVSGAANVGMLLAYMQLVRSLHPGKDIWLWVGALVMSSTTFVVYSRLSVELSALGPLLVITGVMLVERSRHVGPGGWAWAFAGSVLLGLAIYNHMAGAAVVAGLMLGYVVAVGFTGLLDVRTFAALAGLLLGLVPRILQLLRLPPGRGGPTQRLLKNMSANVVADLLYIPQLLEGMADGDLIYHRVVGGSLVWVLPFFAAALLVLVTTRLAVRAFVPQRRDVGVLVAVSVSCALMTLISPHLALRYFILPALALPYLLARLGCMTAEATKVPRWARRLGLGTLAVVTSLQCFYVGVNYFHGHLSTGGSVQVFPLGKNVLESSSGFTRTDRLYARLLDEHIAHVVTENLILWPLQFYDLTAHRLRSTAGHHQRGWRVPKEGATAVIYYNGPTPLGGMKVEDLRGTTTIERQGREFVLEPDMDRNFLVYVHRPAPAIPAPRR